MSLALVIALPLLGGALAWALGRWPLAARIAALLSLAVDLALALGLASASPRAVPASGERLLLAALSLPWMPGLGVRFKLQLDGLSLLLTLLTLLVGLLAVGASWSETRHRVGFYHFNLLWVLSGVLTVFLAADLILFFVGWELMLIPMVYLIGVWGHEDRLRAAFKFVLFTQASGLLMLLSIIALGFIHSRAAGRISFDLAELSALHLPFRAQLPLMLGFVAAFAVKLPVVPLHTWLPDAHTEAPTGGSVVLAGLMLKTGAYGFLRLAVPLFPEAAAWLAPSALWLGAIGVLYGAMLASSQNDLKRIVAYSSVSHLGFVLMGAYSASTMAFQGAVLEMVCHGLSTGGLFIVAGVLQERTHTRDLRRFGGLAAVAPRMGGVTAVLCLASLGLPGLGNFVAEFLVLAGSYRPAPLPTALATLGLIAAMVYSLRLLQRTFHGPNREGWRFADLGVRELLVLGTAVLILFGLGLYPQPVLDRSLPVPLPLGGPTAWTLR